jgi:hypothetical protein
MGILVAFKETEYHQIPKRKSRRDSEENLLSSTVRKMGPIEKPLPDAISANSFPILPLYEDA